MLKIVPDVVSGQTVYALSPDDSAYGYRGAYSSLPGPSPTSESGFLPLSVAISFFFFWVFAVASQPSGTHRRPINSAITAAIKAPAKYPTTSPVSMRASAV